MHGLPTDRILTCLSEVLMGYGAYLAHHGVKGMKWGVRRFQNYDGTRIKNESTQKIKIPKGPYYKWGKERGIRVYDRTKAGNKLFEVMHSTASDVINKLNEDGQMTKTYQDVCKAGWAFTGGVKFNDIGDEYVHAYYDKMERDSTYDYRKCYNSTYDSFQEPNISDKSAFVKILHDAVGKVVTKDVWKEDPNMPSWKESPFYKVQNANPDSAEVQSAYADILKNGKILYEKENRLISLIKKENSRNRLSNDEEQECQELLNDLSYSHGDGRSDFVRPEHSDEWRKHMRDKAYDPGLSEKRLFYRIQDPEKVSHAVITNYDIPSYENYLAHHGIKGQKWGVRRFQNPDGTLTEAGRNQLRINRGSSVTRVSHTKRDPMLLKPHTYVSLNMEDHKKWLELFGHSNGQKLRPVYSKAYRVKNTLFVARAEDIASAVSNGISKKGYYKRDMRMLEAEAKRRGYDWDGTSDADHYSLMIAEKLKTGRKIEKALMKMGFEAMEDVHGKDTAENPIIILNPSKNLSKETQSYRHDEYVSAYKDYYKHRRG